MLAEILREKSGQGTIKEDGDVYRIIISYKITFKDDETQKLKRKYPQKWFTTGLSTKGNNLRRAKQMLKTAFDNFDPYNPDVPLSILLGESESDSESQPTADSVLSAGEPDMAESQPVVVNNDILFADYMEQWLEEYKRNVEETTYAGYKMIVDKKIVPYFREKGIYLNQLTSKDVHAFYNHMRLYGNSTLNRNSLKNKNTSLSAESVRRIHSCVRKALVVAADDEHELLKTNIVSMLKRPEKPNVEEFEPQFYTVEEANELLRVCTGHALEVPIKLALFYGLRREEVLGLRWSSLNFEGDGQVIINNVYVECKIDGEYKDFARPRAKSRSSKRSFHMDNDMRSLLLEHKQRILAQKKRLGKAYNNQQLDYVCVNAMGYVFKPSYVTKNFKKLLDDKGLRPIRFHDLRHTCSSFLLSKGLSLMVVKAHLGHSTYATTERYYGHLDKSAKEQSVRVMAKTGLNIYGGADTGDDHDNAE